MNMATTVREAVGLSQQKLSVFIGGNRSVLTRAEKGERSITVEATLNLVTLFNNIIRVKIRNRQSLNIPRPPGKHGATVPATAATKQLC